MNNKNFTTNLDKKNQPKFLIESITFGRQNSLVMIKNVCKIVRQNLNQTIEFIDLISTCSNRGLGFVDMVFSDIKNEEIDKSKFVYILISTIVEATIREYAFESKKQKKLIDIDLKDDFDFFGDENLMFFILSNLVRHALLRQSKIAIWLNSKNRTLHFKEYKMEILQEQLPDIFDDFFNENDLKLSFCKKIMKSFGGDILVKSVGEETEFYLKF